MADKDLSPEKRLLKIIEGQEGKASSPSAIQTGKKYLSGSSLKARLSFLKAKFKKDLVRTGRSILNLKFVNVLLRLGVVTLVVLLGMSIKIEISDLNNKKILTMAALSPGAQAEPVLVSSFLQPEDYYVDKTRKRNLFDLGDLPKKQIVFKEEEKRKTKLEQMVETLKLVGISWSESPDAIIEDTEKNKSYFVQTGHMINGIKVQAILKDKVILHYDAEEVELK